MEKNINHPITAWDAVPRDGPAVFIADRQRLDTEGKVLGVWINPVNDHQAVRETLIRGLGQEAVTRDDWVLIDQIGLGPNALPERLSIEDLVYLAGALAVGEEATTS